jgi:hypothetical protein
MSVAAPFGVGFLIAGVYVLAIRRRLGTAHPPTGVRVGEEPALS